MTKQEYLEKIRYELCSIQEQAIYLNSVYGDKNFLHKLTVERFLTINNIFTIANYHHYAKTGISWKESEEAATHLYHQSILDSFETIYVSHRKFIGQDF